jgi:hypothetical protein
MDDRIDVYITFTEQTAYGEFRDAINLSLAEYKAISKDALDALKRERMAAFVAHMQMPPAPKTLDPVNEFAQYVSGLKRTPELIEKIAKIKADLEAQFGN